jgi:hypothetical protein
MTKKLIGIAEFNELTEDLQLDLLHSDGVHIGKRRVGTQLVVLIQLYSFYVEVHYRQYRRSIDHIIASESVEMLEPYLHQIYIRDLDHKKGHQ